MNEIPQQPQPHDPQPTNAERNAAVIAHLGGLAWVVGSWLLNIAIPLGVLLVKSDSPYAVSQAKEALNFQISILIYCVVALFLTIITLGIALLVILPVLVIGIAVTVILAIVAAVHTSRGEAYRYPLTIRLVS